MSPSASEPDDHDETTFHTHRAKDGDRDSLEWIVRRLSPLLEVQAGYRLGPTLRRQVDAADLVEEAWLVAIPRLGRIEARDGRLTPVLMKFLSAIVLRRTNEIARRVATREAGRREDASADDFAGKSSSQLSRVIRFERSKRLQALIDEMDETDRKIVVMRGFEQLDNAAVAELLAMKPNTVAQRYKRALEYLKSRLPNTALDELT